MGSEAGSIKPAKIFYTWQQFREDCEKIARVVSKEAHGFNAVYGIPRGGLFVAAQLSYLLDIPLLLDWKKIDDKTLVVDDIYDTGATIDKLTSKKVVPYFAVLWYTEKIKVDLGCRKKIPGDWVVYPWDAKKVTIGKRDGTFR